MHSFVTVTKFLKVRRIPFDEVHFTDSKVAARTTDTSRDGNYDPATAIKTLILKTKESFAAVILKGDESVDQKNMKELTGPWSVADGETLETRFAFVPGTVCPFLLDIPVYINETVLSLDIWSMGAGDVTKGINVKKDDVLKNLKAYRIVRVSKHAIQSGQRQQQTMDAIDTLLTRGVDSVYPSRDVMEKVLRSGKKLTLYQGFDPTGTQLHIGHAVAIRKLRQFQDLGHRVIFLVGDGTGQAGDPSGKMKARGRFMSRDELRANAADYVRQASKIIRFDGPNPVKILYNSDWLNKLTLVDMLDIAQNFSVQQLIERDMYQERMKRGEPINLREFLYPLLQGYDSVAMNVDLELGGTDQTFNMLAGRTLVSAMQKREKFVMTVPLLTDSHGVKIGKTEGNVIALTDPPADFYAKIMSLGDDAVIPCFRLLTDLPLAEIDEMKEKSEKGENPMKFKKRLAYELTKWLNPGPDAEKAQSEWERVHQKGENPAESAISVSIPTKQLAAEELVIAADTSLSKSQAKRLVEQKAVELNGRTLMKGENISLKDEDILKIGKKKFFRIRI